MKKRSGLSQDNLVVSLSLATAIAILLATTAGIWLWSIALERMSTASVERSVESP